MTGIYALVHMAVDLSCAFLVYTYVLGGEQWYLWMLLYNFCAFALQFLRTPIKAWLLLIIGCGLMLMLSSLFQIQIMSYVQILTTNDMIGKVISCVICVCMCANPVGGFIYGIVFEKIGDRVYLPFYAAAVIVTGIGVLTRGIFREVDRKMA